MARRPWSFGRGGRSDVQDGSRGQCSVRSTLAAAKPFLAETTLETRNPMAVLFSRFYLRANVMAFTMWFFALLGYYGLTSWLAVILEQYGFSVVKSVGFITLITFGGIPGFYTAALLLERIGRKPTTAVFLFMSATMAYVYGHSGQHDESVPQRLRHAVLHVRHVVLPLCLYAGTLSDPRPIHRRRHGFGMRPRRRHHWTDRRWLYHRCCGQYRRFHPWRCELRPGGTGRANFGRGDARTNARRNLPRGRGSDYGAARAARSVLIRWRFTV